MKAMKKIGEKLIPVTLNRTLLIDGEKRNYRQLQVLLTVIMITIALGPVFVTAALSYYNYSEMLQKEEASQLDMRLSVKIKTISSMVGNLKSVILFSARGQSQVDLIKKEKLEELYFRIKQEYPFVVDLGVIDHSGKQLAYYGPYNLLGSDYSQETWMKEVVSQGEYISNVYLGHRKVPHFTIAVADTDVRTNLPWILRVTINASTLQKFIDTIETTDSSDLFLIDEEGMLQTQSNVFGEALRKYVPAFVLDAGDAQPLDQSNTLHIIGKIPKTPWSLVIINEKYSHEDDWVMFRNKLALIVFTCIVVSVILVHFLVSIFTNTIKKSDKLQLTFLKDSEHRDRLASIGRLAAGVGHEINNPLAIINQKTGLIEDLMLLTSDFEHKETMADCLRSVNQSVERCKAVTHRLLGFARQQGVTLQELPANSILKEVYDFLENALMQNRINVKFQLEEDLPPVLSDHLQLQQIFLNIINNSIDAIGKDGEITIVSHMVAGEVRVVIQDDGPGMKDEVVKHIFEPFFTTKETGEGTGLGLSITYGLIKKLGGDITVRSTLGMGTAFTITIPTQRDNNDINRT